jgi:tellurite resistance protein
MIDATSSAEASGIAASGVKASNRVAAEGGAGAADWKAGLPEDIRAHPALGQFRDVAALAKEHVNLQTLIGRKGIIPPTDRDAPHAWDRFYNSLGRPEAPDGYDLAPPAGMPEGLYSADMAKAYSEAAHKAGLSAKQAHALHDWFVGLSANAARARDAQQARERDGLETELRIEWGADYGAKLAAARRAARAFSDGDTLDKLEQTLGGAAMVRMFANIGEQMTEDRLIGAGGGDTIAGPEQAKAEIARIRGEALKDPKHALNDRFHPEHGRIVAKLEKLYVAAYPEAPA